MWESNRNELPAISNDTATNKSCNVVAFIPALTKASVLIRLRCKRKPTAELKIYRGATQTYFRWSSVETMRMKQLFLAAAVLCFIFSCRKETRNAETFCFDGMVRYLGSPAADGLGWVLYKEDSVSGQTYIPQNLSDDFKVDRQKITVCVYKTDEKFSCFCAAPLDVYHIVSIRSR